MVNKMAKSSKKSPVIENASVESVAAAVKSAIETTETVAVVAAVVSKASLARLIWDEELAKQTATGAAMSRKAVVDRFVKEAGLTIAGARTYFQNNRDKAGLVVKRTVAAVADTTSVAETTSEATA